MPLNDLEKPHETPLIDCCTNPRPASVVRQHGEEALSFNHQFIGTEHLLVGLLREQEGLAALALEKLGVALDPIRAAVEEKIGRGDQPVQEEIDYVPRARKVLSLALDEAERQGSGPNPFPGILVTESASV